jgi:GTPase Era involved in 16S rRNA processing
MVILGNTKAGKSTLLNEIMSGHVKLNTGASRETAFMWRLCFSDSYSQIDLKKIFTYGNSKK